MSANLHVFPVEPKPRKRVWARQECGCGCKREEHWNRLRMVRIDGGPAYFVTADCEEAFRSELDAREKLGHIFKTMRHSPFWKRWSYARMVWLLTYVRLNRLQGEKRSRHLARRQATLFCLPNWVTKRLGPIWKP